MVLGESRRGGFRPIYEEAADAVLERIFGEPGIATRILNTNSYSGIARIVDKIDYMALFRMLEVERTYNLLAGLVLYKYKVDRGQVPNTKKAKNAIKDTINIIRGDFDIRGDSADSVEEMIKDFVKARKGSMRDEDDVFSPIGYGSIMEDEDDYYGPNNLSSIMGSYGNLTYDDDNSTAFDKYAAMNGKRQSQTRQAPTRFEANLDEDDYSNDRSSSDSRALASALESINDTNRMILNKLDSQRAQPMAPPTPAPSRRKSTPPPPDNIAVEATVSNMMTPLVRNLGEMIGQMQVNMQNSLINMQHSTNAALNDIHDRLDELDSRPTSASAPIYSSEEEDYEPAYEPAAENGHLYRTSNEASLGDQMKAELDRAVQRSIKNADADTAEDQ